MTSARTSRRTPDPVRHDERVSVLLRTRTRAAHDATERAFDLQTHLAGRGAYRSLLLRLRGVHAPLEDALGAVPGWSAAFPTLDLGSRRRVPLLDDDLAGLGADGTDAGPGRLAAPVPELGSPAQALGCLYVLEGSALGGRLVARHARAALGADLPVAFFAGDGGRALGREWRDLQDALDAVPRTLGPAAVAHVVAGAERTFAAVLSALVADAPAGAGVVR